MTGGHVKLPALQQSRAAIDVDVGDVSDVVALPLQPTHHRMLDQRASVWVDGIRTIEAHLITALAVERSRVGQLVHVQADPAPGVVGLPARHVGLHQERCRAPRFSNHEGHVALEAIVRGQLEQVVTTHPARFDAQLDGRWPSAFDQARSGADAWLRLGHDAEARAGADQARAETLVVADAIQIPTDALSPADVDGNANRIAHAG